MAIEVIPPSRRRAMPISERNHARAPTMTIPADHPSRQGDAHQPAGTLTHQPAGARTRGRRRLPVWLLRWGHVPGTAPIRRPMRHRRRLLPAALPGGEDCTCLGYQAETNRPLLCCGDATAPSTDCNDPQPDGCVMNPASCGCLDSNDAPVCCGLPTGNYSCGPWSGKVCTAERGLRPRSRVRRRERLLHAAGPGLNGLLLGGGRRRRLRMFERGEGLPRWRGVLLGELRKRSVRVCGRGRLLRQRRALLLGRVHQRDVCLRRRGGRLHGERRLLLGYLLRWRVRLRRRRGTCGVGGDCWEGRSKCPQPGNQTLLPWARSGEARR